MERSFSPTSQDVERYRRLRAASMELSNQIVNTIPRRALNEIGEALGLLRDGVLVLPREDTSSILMDCCLYEWFENGKNLVQRYAETHPGMPGTDESYLLNAYLHAEYRILAPQSVAPGAGLYCDDVRTGEQLFLMDLALSRTLVDDRLLATRIVPLGEYSMTGGAGLPIDKETLLRILSRNSIEENGSFDPTGRIALPVVRACLAAGVADQVAYQAVGSKSKPTRREPRFEFKRRRRRAN